MKRFFAGVAILTAIIVLAITAVRLAAGLTLSVGDCSLPCVTPLQQVQAQLNRDQLAFEVSDNDPTIPLNQWAIFIDDPTLPSGWDANVSLGVFSKPFLAFKGLKSLPSRFALGDAMLLFGDPISATLCWRDDNAALSQPYIGAHIYFKNHVELLAYDLSHHDEMRYNPTMTVWLITYFSSDTGPLYPFDAPLWYGFTGSHNDPQVC